MTIGQEPRQEAHAYPPTGYAGPPPPAYGPPGVFVPQQRSRRRRTIAIAVAAGVVAGVVAATATVAITSGRHSSTPAAPAAVPVPPQASSAPAPLTPEAAQAQTCAVLKAGYEPVANAIDARNRFQVNDWTDPALLSATSSLISVATGLAADLERSLEDSTPPELRLATIDYITGLRALSISERDHSSAKQLNGVGALYNQVVDAPLRLCGIPG